MRHFLAVLLFLLPTPSAAYDAVCGGYTRIYSEPALNSQSWIIREGDPFLVGLEVEATVGGGVFNQAKDIYGRTGYIDPGDLQGCRHDVTPGTYYPRLVLSDTIRYIQNEINLARESSDVYFNIYLKDRKLIHVTYQGVEQDHPDFYIDLRHIEEITIGSENTAHPFIYFDCSRACVFYPDHTRSNRTVLEISAFSAAEVAKIALAFKHLCSFFPKARSKDPFEIK
ncbi:hypothetical protein EOA32_10930 [Mesorhizobium sp. M1A.F.Ca.ET.072.01.1.1]|uniref:hypothetical protein n=1 Tax=Mesorhizobium sp. M1A.F.Ca.ET.072.01.1.1 TaxID=2496753 RepID=UPI000FD54CDB|nr:hypothetical protein [Mesorhizobium sp. M1A.F.Ca.ET.072.01.1.1]RUW52989.1 hypothetical protein EOA32_10930 [Mesorhizobium sp. M1A.F.Ca.ET.072.01.1.1]TIV04357.1 MAG: hypothetical protein E5W04_04025 [Mesorhizobium sp.]